METLTKKENLSKEVKEVWELAICLFGERALQAEEQYLHMA